MILSVSRRTDIPRFYYEWFLHRLQAGFVLVRGPMNHRQVSRVALSPETVECIAFWSKNPAPMLGGLQPLAPYPFFIQFTLNPYGRDIEASLPDVAQRIACFRELARAVGPQRMVWRYSPILLRENYSPQFHLEAFAGLAAQLEGSTQTCRISFLDLYKKIAPRMGRMGITDLPEAQKAEMTRRLVEIGRAHGIAVGGCGNLGPAAAGLAPAGCIDAVLVSRITGNNPVPGRDPGQRDSCYCAPSIDIGSYNTCQNGCVYCYANQQAPGAQAGAARYDPTAPMLCDAPRPGDRITDRKIPPKPDGQLCFL